MSEDDQQITAILVDLDGVLRHWPDEASSIEESQGLPLGTIQKIAFAAAQLQPAIHGVVNDAKWRESIVTELLRVHPGCEAGDIVRLWSTSTGELDTHAIDALSTYSPSIKLVLATNATTRLQTDLEKLGILDLFSGIANSSALGYAKPEHEFFEAALKIAGARPNQALFIDDSLANVEAATLLGIQSHHFVDVNGMKRFMKIAA